MLSRALSLAAASLIGCLMVTAGQAQNLDAGKSPVQIFNSTCTACHKSAKGLLKTVSPSSLPGFLRQHYTTGSEMAQMLSGFLMSNGAGAADVRVGTGRQGGKPVSSSNLRPDAPIGITSPDAGQGAEKGSDKDRDLAQRPERKPPHAAGAGSDTDGIQSEGAQTASGRKPHRLRPGVTSPDSAQPPAEAAAPSDQSGTKPGAKEKLAKRHRKGEPPMAAPAEQSAPEIAAKPEAKPEAQPEAKSEPARQPLPERDIDAAVPVPEPVNLPPPTAADIKPEPQPAEPSKTVSDKTVPEKAVPEKAGTEAPKPPSAAAAATAPSGPPAPPISQ